DFTVEIEPVRIRAFDQLNFPTSLPKLHLLFAPDSGFHRVVALVVDQGSDPIAACEAVKEAFPVLPYPLRKIARHADIKRAIAGAGQDVNTRLHVSSVT